MADDICTYRTNYFRVTDEEKYQKLINKLAGEDLEIFDDENSNGMDTFYKELQQILPNGEAMILQEAGHEKLNYVAGIATIITNKEIRFLDLSKLAVKTAGDMLGTDFQTQMDY